MLVIVNSNHGAARPGSAPACPSTLDADHQDCTSPLHVTSSKGIVA